MAAKLRIALLSAGTAALTAAAALGAAAPAFAKSSTELSGPRAVQAGHAFRLTVWVGDDAGAEPASARLQQLGADGRYHWLGPWHRLRLTDANDESGTFTLTEGHRGTLKFRAVISRGYAITNPVHVAVR